MVIIKKIAFLVILAGVCLVPVRAQKSAYRFSLSPVLGCLYGESDEIVYKDPPNSDLYHSRLIWDIKPLFYAGLAADFGPNLSLRDHGFSAALSLRFGLPLRTGIIEDWDWLNINQNYPTHYSRHNANSAAMVFADLSAGYSWRITDFIDLKAFGEFSYMRLSWAARDGYIQYPQPNPSGTYSPWNDSYEKDYFSGKLIEYSQNWFILSPGISMKWNMNKYFSLEGFFNYSPLIYCNAKDNHIVRNSKFYDSLFFGHYIKGRGELTFFLRDKTGLSLFASYRHITDTRGDTSINSSKFEDSAGAGHSAFDLGITVKFLL